MQMSRDGVDQTGAQGKHEAEARDLSPPGLWEEKKSQSQPGGPGVGDSRVRHVPRRWRLTFRKPEWDF